MDVQSLKKQLEDERKENSILKSEIHSLKKAAVALGAEIEAEEEMITNKLMKRLSQLKLEKEKLAMEVEREEEYMTNMLQKKLQQVQREKVDLENELETEQECMVNKLQKQIGLLTAENEKLSMKHVTEIVYMKSRINDTVSKMRNMILQGKNTIEDQHHMKDQILKLLEEIKDESLSLDYDKPLMTSQNSFLSHHVSASSSPEDDTVQSLIEENQRLKDANFQLKQRVKREREQAKIESGYRTQLEFDAEIGSEHAFNINAKRDYLNSNSQSAATSIGHISLPASIRSTPPRSISPAYLSSSIPYSVHGMSSVRSRSTSCNESLVGSPNDSGVGWFSSSSPRSATQVPTGNTSVAIPSIPIDALPSSEQTELHKRM